MLSDHYLDSLFHQILVKWLYANLLFLLHLFFQNICIETLYLINYTVTQESLSGKHRLHLSFFPLHHSFFLFNIVMNLWVLAYRMHFSSGVIVLKGAQTASSLDSGSFFSLIPKFLVMTPKVEIFNNSFAFWYDKMYSSFIFSLTQIQNQKFLQKK